MGEILISLHFNGVLSELVNSKLCLIRCVIASLMIQHMVLRCEGKPFKLIYLLLCYYTLEHYS